MDFFAKSSVFINFYKRWRSHKNCWAHVWNLKFQTLLSIPNPSFVNATKPFRLNFDFFRQIIVRIVHDFWETLDEFWIHLIESLRHRSKLSDLIRDILKKLLRNVVILEEMESLHGVKPLKIDPAGAINRFLDNQRWILRVKFPRQCPGGSSGVGAVVEVSSFLPFVSRQCNFWCVDADDMVAAIVWKGGKSWGYGGQ